MRRRIGKRILALALFAFLLITAVAVATSGFFKTKPKINDQSDTDLVAAKWIKGIGCPPGNTACPTSPTNQVDPNDPDHQGLLLSNQSNEATTGFLAGTKTKKASIPNHWAQVDLTGVKGITLTELGYNIRKHGSAGSSQGSQCSGSIGGTGSPYFQVIMSDNSEHDYKCGSGLSVSKSSKDWLQLQKTSGFPTAPLTVKTISIIFGDSSQNDPTMFGAAILDNIDVNGHFVGHQN